MADPFSYTYPSPLAPYAHTKDLPALPDKMAADGKSYVNPARADGKLSESYERFVEPLDNGRRGGL
jgi:DOPA 4,5-dioxygenase